ncbi:hypothetical protein Q8A67_025624 [Cirrhinus molitorella]|uniref:Uncharacterized protein n=1 Tax=Cirrhinus molitorella TaxID=172907 RepID=A0AA88T8F7_9TELE|nr:hypothetical protein Q8A67_025624 [Cirrhinus molitorella]
MRGESVGCPSPHEQCLQLVATLRGENLECLLEEGKWAVVLESSKDGAVRGGEHLGDGQIRFSGLSQSDKEVEMFIPAFQCHQNL